MEESASKTEEKKSIDEILYSIKEREFKEKIIKKDLDIDINVRTYYSEESAVIEFAGKEYVFEPQSRNITFKDDQKSIVKFVCNCKHLEEILKQLQFKAFNIDKDEEKESIDSLSSENNKTEILNIFKNKDIKEIYKDKPELEKLIDKFRQRYSKKIIYISNLSLNSSFYFPNNKNDKINFKILSTFKNELFKFFMNDCSILYVVGPKGTSKSIFLMNFFYEINRGYKIPLLYINYRKMKDLSIDKKKNIFKKELIYLFFEENFLVSFYKEKPYEKIKSEKLLQFLYDFIKYLLDIYKNYFNEQIVVVIDNLDEDDDNEIIRIQYLIDLIKKEENRPKIKLILSGRCKFMNKKQLFYLKNELNMEKNNNREMLLYYNINLIESDESDISNISNDEINNMNSLPLYYFNSDNSNDIDNTKKMRITEEKDFCKKFNIYGMYFSTFYEGREIKISDLEKNYEIMPIDFLVFTIYDNNNISFKFHNEIFKSAVKNSINHIIQENNFMYILNNFDNNRITYGIFEEKLLILFLSCNKLNLIDLEFTEENKLEVEEIFQFKNNAFDKTNKVIDKNKPIIITQENYLGQNYDLLILIPKKSLNSYKAYFIQIGTNKTKTQIDIIKTDLKEKESKYKEGIEKFTGCNISEVELVFIFDKDTQIGLKNKNQFSGAKYCIENNILFYLFSIEDQKLCSTNDLEIMILIDKFESFKPKKAWKRNYNKSKGDFSFLPYKETKIINSFIEDDIKNNYMVSNGGHYIYNLNQCEKESIYIFYNNKERIYIIKQKYYQIINGNLVNIKKKILTKKSHLNQKF